MDGWKASDYALIISGSVGVIYALIKLFQFVGARLDARRERKQQEITNALEFKRLIHSTDEQAEKTVTDALWKIIDEKNLELDACKRENLTRPLVKQLYTKLREIRVEAEKCDGCEIKGLIDEMEGLLP